MIPSRELALPGTPATVGQLQHQSSETFLQPTHFWSHRVSRGGRRAEDARILTLTQQKNHFSLNKSIDFLTDTLWLSGKHLDQLGQTADPKAFSIMSFFLPMETGTHCILLEVQFSPFYILWDGFHCSWTRIDCVAATFACAGGQTQSTHLSAASVGPACYGGMGLCRQVECCSELYTWMVFHSCEWDV